MNGVNRVSIYDIYEFTKIWNHYFYHQFYAPNYTLFPKIYFDVDFMIIIKKIPSVKFYHENKKNYHFYACEVTCLSN